MEMNRTPTYFKAVGQAYIGKVTVMTEAESLIHSEVPDLYRILWSMERKSAPYIVLNRPDICNSTD